MRTEVEIANELFEAREAEKQANERRVELEEELIAILGQKEEGAQTHEVGDYKVTITGKLIRKIDWDLYDKSIAAKIPESLQPVKVKRELDDSGVKYLANNEPQIYRLLAKALTIKPAKTAVNITKGA
jgi:hypothetical protein